MPKTIKPTMKFEDKKEYLCALGTTLQEKVNEYDVGTYYSFNDLFSFKNGSYSNTELKFRKKIGSSISCVLEAKLIEDIDFTN